MARWRFRKQDLVSAINGGVAGKGSLCFADHVHDAARFPVLLALRR